MSLAGRVSILAVRSAVGARLPSRWFRATPDLSELRGRSGPPLIEIVSHCWGYAHLLTYQLSSLVNHPPTQARVRMTVFHSPVDTETRLALEFFGELHVPGVEWNWLTLPPRQLFRRAIGRNRVARETPADWVWFTDCDVLFRRDCIDTLAYRLQERRDPLLYPRQERITRSLPDSHPLLSESASGLRVLDVDPMHFELSENPPKAKGAYQIVHGDLARQFGYCGQLASFQEPASRWAKTYEDSAFRWLVGTPGTSVDIPGVYRIRHATKGRYGKSGTSAAIRSFIRRAKARGRRSSSVRPSPTSSTGSLHLHREQDVF